MALTVYQPTENIVLAKTYEAGETLVKNVFVALDTSNEGVVNLPSAGAKCIGVTMNAAASGQNVSVMLIGVAIVIATGAITRGDSVQALATGYVDTAASADYPCGQADMAAAAAGDLISVILNFSDVPRA